MSESIKIKYGKESIVEALDYLLLEKDKEVVAIGVSKTFTDLYSQEWRASWQLRRIKNKILGKAIYNTDPETAEYIKENKVPTLFFKFLPSYYNGNRQMTIFICGESTAFFYYKAKPMRTVIIKDREITNAYKQQFKELWGQAKTTIGEDYFNIFERPDIAKNYGKIRNIPESIFAESAKLILANLKKKEQPLSIVEGGCGNGRLTIPLLEQLQTSNTNYNYQGFDVSDPMLNEIQKNKITRLPQVKIFKNSAYNLSLFKNEKVDAYIISHVLHVAKYKQILNESWRIFKKIPTYFVFRDDDFIRLINGNKTRITGQPADFWTEYWDMRKGFSLQSPKSITDVYPFSKPINYIREHGKNVNELGVLKWNFTETYGGFLKYILMGAYTALGNIPEDWRKLIYHHMKSWLKNKNINLNTCVDFIGEQIVLRVD